MHISSAGSIPLIMLLYQARSPISSTFKLKWYPIFKWGKCNYFLSLIDLAITYVFFHMAFPLQYFSTIAFAYFIMLMILNTFKILTHTI